jgi:cytochrome b
MARLNIWDRPTRLFHWLLVLAIPLLWWTAEEERIDLHRLIGLSVLGLLLFRLLWGLFGSSTARFASFLKGPRGIMAYLAGRAPPTVGHNAIGGWSVIAMLTVLVGQVGLGLFSSDEDGLEEGPLAYLISSDLAEEAAELHEKLFDVLLVLIAIHIAAIMFYTLVKRQNLVGPMLSGRGEGPDGAAPMRSAPTWRFLLAILLAGGAAWWIGNGA